MESFISVPPSLQILPPSGQVVTRKGGPVSFECKANGNPPPTVQWSKKVDEVTLIYFIINSSFKPYYWTIWVNVSYNFHLRFRMVYFLLVYKWRQVLFSVLTKYKGKMLVFTSVLHPMELANLLQEKLNYTCSVSALEYKIRRMSTKIIHFISHS